MSSLDCLYIYLCDNDYIHVGSKVNTMTNLEINVNRKPLNIKISLILQWMHALAVQTMVSTNGKDCLMSERKCDDVMFKVINSQEQ